VAFYFIKFTLSANTDISGPRVVFKAIVGNSSINCVAPLQLILNFFFFMN